MRSTARPTGCSASAILLAAACVASIRPAAAAVDLSAGVTAGTQYDTNARQLASIESPVPTDDGKIFRDDISMFISANVAAAVGGDGPLQGRAQVSYSHSESMRLDTLGHDDYSIGAGLNWRPGQVFDVSLQASQDRLPLGLADIGGNELAQQSSRRVEGTLRLRPTPRWQLSLTPGWSESKTALPDATDFRLRETSGTASIEFLGAGRLVPGIAVSESESRYSGIENATRYNQRSVQGTLSYRLTQVSAFSLAAGQTRRSTHLIDPSTDPTAVANEGTSTAFTGSLSFSRQLTAKTGVNVNVFRNFQQYDAGVNRSIGTGFNAGVNWAATAKVSVGLDTSFTWSTIENVPFGDTTTERKDLVRAYSLSTNYLATRSVSITTRLTRTIRRSEIWTDQFNGTSASVQLSIRFD
jgi:hypothetical protein